MIRRRAGTGLLPCYCGDVRVFIVLLGMSMIGCLVAGVLIYWLGFRNAQTSTSDTITGKIKCLLQ
jgi:hypothetical protein